jgi:hypothetical protein
MSRRAMLSSMRERQAYVFEAELVGHPGVSRTIALAGDQTLELLHEHLRVAFRWDDDHLYSFWLDGSFWGDPETEYTAPFEPEEGARTADVHVDALGLAPGRKLAYVFDFGDEWRVTIWLRNIRPAAGARLPQIVESRGEAPPQYESYDEEGEGADDTI